MANARPLYLNAGKQTQQQYIDVLRVNHIDFLTTDVDTNPPATMNLFSEANSVTTALNLFTGMSNAALTISIGNANSTVSVLGDLAVQGDETVVGDTIFETDVTFGDNSGDPTNITFAADAKVVSNMIFDTTGGARSITGNGGNALTLTNAAAGVTVSTTASGAVTVTSAANIDMNSATGFTLDNATSGSIAITNTGRPVTVASGGTSSWANTAGGLTISTATSGALTLTSADAATWSTTAGLLSVTGAGGLTATATTNALTLTSTAANIDVNSATGFTLDNSTSGSIAITNTGRPVTVASGGTSSWANTAGGLTISTATSGALTLTSADAATWSTTAGLLSVTGAGGLTATATTNALTLTSTAADVDINAATGVTVDGTTISIDGTGVSNFSTSGASLTVESSHVSGQVILNANGATAGEVEINGRLVDVNAGAAGITLDSSADIYLTSTNVAGGIGLVTDGTVYMAPDLNVYMNLQGGTGHLYIETGAGSADDYEIIRLRTWDPGPTQYNASIRVGPTSPGGSVTGNTGDLYLDAGSGAPYYCTGGTSWTQVGSATGYSSLQNAYDTGQTIQLVDTKGDLIIDTDDTGTAANFILRNEAGTANYLATDAANAQLELGASGSTVTVGFLGYVDTNLTFETSGGAKTITGDGTNGLTVTSGPSTALTLTSPVAATWSTTAGLLTLSGAGGVTVTSTGGTMLLNGTGQLVDINSAALDIDASGAITIDGTSTMSFTAISGKTIFTCTGQEFEVNAATVDVNATSTVDIDGTAISLGGTAASDFTVAAANLTLQTTSSGNIIVNSAANVTIDGAGVSIDGTLASNFSTTSANLTISTITSGSLSLHSAAAFDLQGAATSTINVTGGQLNINTTTTGNIRVAPESGYDLELVAAGATGELSLVSGAGGISATATAGQVTLSTITSGGILLDSVGAIDLQADAASTFLVAGANLQLQTTTSGDITLLVANEANSDIVFSAHGGTTVNFNDATYNDLDSFPASYRTVCGALDYLLGQASDVKITVTSGEAYALGAALYLNTADGKAYQCDADAAASSVFIGFAVDAAGAADETRSVYVAGEVVVSTDLSTLANGTVVYLSTTAGAVTSSAPSGTGDVVLRVGVVSDKANDKIVIQVGEPVQL